MESFADKARAFGFAVGLHLVVFLALVLGLWWTNETKPVVMPGPVIEATLVGPTAAPRPRGGAAKPAPPPPAPEPPKPEPPKPAPAPPKPEPPAPKPQKETPSAVPRQDQVDQERIAALAEQKAEEQKKEQEEKQRQRQVLLDQEQEKQRKIREEAQRQLADIRKQREAAEKALNREKQRLQQLEDLNQKDEQAQDAAPTEQEAKVATTGANGQDNDLMARYAAAIQAAVTQNWNRPDSAPPGLRCTLHIQQIPGGEVLGATVGSPCNADAATRNSIEQAVRKAAPLPYQGYEKVFQRNITFNFKYDGQ